MSVNLAAMKEDTSQILTDWGESLIIKRAALAHDDEGKPTQTWATPSTITGEWQPVTGKTERVEVGRKIKSDAQVICAVDENVQEGDRMYRADSTYMIVNYIKKYEDHWTVFLTKTEGEQ